MESPQLAAVLKAAEGLPVNFHVSDPKGRHHQGRVRDPRLPSLRPSPRGTPA